jgi:hypothetical protein
MQIGAPHWGCASGKFAKPLSTTATRCQRLLRHPNDDCRHNLSTTRNDEVADRGGFRTLALRIGCILDITPRMNSALLIQQGIADGKP